MYEMTAFSNIGFSYQLHGGLNPLRAGLPNSFLQGSSSQLKVIMHIFQLHRMHEMLTTFTDVCSVSVSICPSVCHVA